MKSTKTKKEKNSKAKLSFSPKMVVKQLLSSLPERALDVVTKRYGLGKEGKKMTLEAIGQEYGITRERVRQIENYALSLIRKSDEYKAQESAMDELEGLISAMGAVVPEEVFLYEISKDSVIQNHIHLLLVLGHPFLYEKENDHFTHRWHVDEYVSKNVETALKKMYESLSDDELVQESDFMDRFLSYVKDVSDQFRDEEIVKRWLSLSKKLGKNKMGYWGRNDSPNINPRGIRDYAYLILSEHGSPLHFSEVANQITSIFDKKAHTATTHNELIKDPRFVLVGRGLYALTDWGYVSGVVSDVIRKMIDEYGPMTKDEIVEKVTTERYVKPNTIFVNLQNPKKFVKMDDGRYDVK